MMTRFSKNITRPMLGLAVLGMFSIAPMSHVQAGSAGLVDTDRFGYDGTIVRYGSEADARDANHPTDTIDITDRDVALFISSESSTTGLTDNDWNAVWGSWYYTTDDQGRAGWGNTNGNTGVGFMQLFDADGSTDTNVDMAFDGYDGTHWTEFHLSLEGKNAGSDDYARLSAIDNVNDGGEWLDYELNLTATGLEGEFDSSEGLYISENQPTGVSGSFTGLFHLTENDTKGNTPDNRGWYTADFTFTMDNWAWENKNDLMTQDGDGNAVPDSFADSTFASTQVVPSPTAAFGGLMLLGGLALRRRRRVV